MRKALKSSSAASLVLLVLSFLFTLFAGPASAAHIWGEEAWQLDSTAWPSTLRSANATGQVSIPARNLSLPYPGTSGPSNTGSSGSDADADAASQANSHRLEDWSLVIRVAAAVPVAETDSNDDDAADVDDIPDDEAYFTATEISYRPSSDLNDRLGPNGTHPSWTLCQHFFRSAKLTSDDEAEVSPDCEGVLSEACRTDLLLQLRGSYGSGGSSDGDRDSAENGDGNGNGRDSSICSAGAGGLPASCLDEMRGENSEPGETQEEEERFDFMSGSAGYSLDLGNPRYGVRFGHGNHSADDHDDYDAAIRQIWVAAFIWGPRNASTIASSSTDGDEDEDEASLPPGTLSCIRASDVEEGSRVLEDGAVTARSPGGKAWAALAVAAGAVALMV